MDKSLNEPSRHVSLFMETFPARSETWNWSVAKGLVAKGYDVTVAAVGEGDWGIIGGREAFGGDAVYPLKFPRLHRLGKARRFVEFGAEAGQLLLQKPRLALELMRKYPLARVKAASTIWTHQALRYQLPQPTLMHGLFGLSARRAQMLRSAGIVHGPVVGTFGGFDINVVGRREGSEYYQEFYREVDHVIAVSEFIRRKLIDDGLSPKKVDVLYYGVDLTRFQFRPPKTEGERLNFIAVGRLVECKGLEYAIDAFEEVQRHYPKAHLNIVGDGPLRTSLQERAAAKLRQGSYTFSGAIPHAQVKVALTESDILLAPAVVGSDGAEEALGGSIIEAHAIGLPVICGDVGGVSEAMIDGVSGILVPEKNVDALVAAMLELADNRAKWPEMADDGLRLAQQNFEATTHLDKLEVIYEKTWCHYLR